MMEVLKKHKILNQAEQLRMTQTIFSPLLGYKRKTLCKDLKPQAVKKLLLFSASGIKHKYKKIFFKTINCLISPNLVLTPQN